ncbi:hypothetical protein [Pectobacterium aquaticum]|uniref:hypothetical protein n=1 Tax=Pectobacterium aquaticum TaxID=2204145 RepID=UPI0034D38AFD
MHNLPDVAPENAKSKTYWKKLQEKRKEHNLTREDIFTILEHGFDEKVSVFYNELLKFINS